MILIFGKTGQVARELARLAPEARFLGRDEADLMQPEACAAAIVALRPDAAINAAAYTAVDKAESEEAIAMTVNGAAPGAMAQACALLEIPFVHISTDYVFDGTGTTPWRPDGPTGPLGAYGRTKLAGEIAIRDCGAVHAIVRTSWIFSAHGRNFVKTMLRLSETRDAITVVDDQIGGPTPASAIAEACLVLAHAQKENPATAGIYHLSGAPDVSWADFAREVFAQAGRPTTVTGIPTSAYPSPAPRPANSRLDCTCLSALGLERPDWKAQLNQVLIELGAAK